MTDLEYLVRDKYHGDASLITTKDTDRLASGEPLAYVIGWIPFLGLQIDLQSKPLIPRPETEWWTELLISHIQKTHGDDPVTILDLCAGSGAIGLALLNALPTAQVYFIEHDDRHLQTIQTNMTRNDLDPLRAHLFSGDLFENVPELQFDVIACNPPYIPSTRSLETAVTAFEPSGALYSGTDGLNIIRRIANEVPAHLKSGGSLWLEADIDNIEEAKTLLLSHGAQSAVIQNDLYGRPRLVIAYY
jgi:release factor glutamine methyltransferase